MISSLFLYYCSCISYIQHIYIYIYIYMSVYVSVFLIDVAFMNPVQQSISQPRTTVYLIPIHTLDCYQVPTCAILWYLFYNEITRSRCRECETLRWPTCYERKLSCWCLPYPIGRNRKMSKQFSTKVFDRQTCIFHWLQKVCLLVTNT